MRDASTMQRVATPYSVAESITRLATQTTGSDVCEDRGWACEPVLEMTSNVRVSHVVGWLSERPLQIAIIILIGVIANNVLRSMVSRVGDRAVEQADKLGGYVPSSVHNSYESGRTQARAATITSVARSITTGAVVLVVVAFIMSTLGVSLAALFASAGVVGVALGFGAQSLIRDVLAGWFIVVEDRYGVGDTIDAGGQAVGVVERVTLRSTRLRSVDGTVWHVANGEILQVGNRSQSWSRAVVDILVDPSADVDRACTLLEEICEDLHQDDAWTPHVKGLATVLGVQRMSPAGITLRVIWDTEPAEQFAVERELRRRVLRRFETEGMKLATGQSIETNPLA